MFGHSDVSILDGGLPRWLHEGGPINTDSATTPTPVSYTAALNKDLVRNMEDIVEALKNKNVQVCILEILQYTIMDILILVHI